MNTPFVRPEGQNGRDAVPPLRRDPVGAARRFFLAATGVFTLFVLLAGCSDRNNAVSGTIEVDEAHVGPRAGGRVEKIFAWEGDRLHEGQVIVQLDASELRARRDLATAQIDTAVHDADAQDAQLVFLRDDAKRQQDLLQRKVVSPLTPSAPRVWRMRRRRMLPRRRCALPRRVRNLQISTRS